MDVEAAKLIERHDKTRLIFTTRKCWAYERLMVIKGISHETNSSTYTKVFSGSQAFGAPKIKGSINFVSIDFVMMR